VLIKQVQLWPHRITAALAAHSERTLQVVVGGSWGGFFVLENFVDINVLHFDATDTEGVSLSICETSPITVHLARPVNRLRIVFSAAKETVLARVKPITATFRLRRGEELRVDVSEGIGSLLWNVEAVCL